MLWFQKTNKLVPKLKKEELLLNVSSDLILILDSHHRVLETNNQVETFFNFSNKEIIGKKLTELPFLSPESNRNEQLFSYLNGDLKTFELEVDVLDRYKNKQVFSARLARDEETTVLELKDTSILQKEHNDERSGLDFLSEASVKLIELLSEKDIYQYVANQLSKLVPRSCVLVNAQTSSTIITTVATAVSDPVFLRGYKVIGGDPVGRVFEINQKATFTLNRGKLVRLKGGISELTFKQIPKPIAILAEKAAGIKGIFSIGFFWKGELFGSAAILTLEEMELPPNSGVIETFINLASVALQRRRMEDQLKLTIEALDQEKKKLSEEKDKLDIILHSIGDGVFVVNDQLKIIHINETAVQMTGFSGVVNKNFKDAFAFIDEKTGKPADFIEECLKNKTVKKITGKLALKVDQALIPVDITAAPLSKEDKGSGCVVVFRDVAKERQVDKAKTEFVSLASHQLRSPLAAINWNTELLIKHAAGLKDEEKEYLKEVARSSSRMGDLVKSLLNVSRIELGTFVVVPKPTSLVEIIESLFKELELLIKQKQIKLVRQLKYTKETMVDPILIRIVFQNLLTNAVKYSQKSGHIDVKLESDDKNWLFTVTDHGVGIPQDQQSQIFTKLFRADNVRLKEIEGNGLGLYIVKSIVETAGGQIWFQSKENKGSSFFVKMPLSGMIKREGSKALDE